MKDVGIPVGRRCLGLVGLLAGIATLLVVATVTASRSGAARPWLPRAVARPDLVVRGRAAADPRQGARRAGERFLRAYVAFLYGRRGPNELPETTDALRSELRRGRIRVPPARRNRNTTIIALRTVAPATHEIRVSAAVDDGDLAPYEVSAIVVRIGRRWLATHVASG